MQAEYKGFTIIQPEDDYNSIFVLRDEKKVMFLNVSKIYTKDSIIRTVGPCIDMYLSNSETVSCDDCADLVYDGFDPC